MLWAAVRVATCYLVNDLQSIWSFILGLKNIRSKFAVEDGNFDSVNGLRYAQGVYCSQMQVSYFS